MKARYLALSPLAILLAGAPAKAANFYWDADSVAADNQNGNGTWNASNNNWTSSAVTTTVDPQVVWGNTGSDTAFLGNAGGAGYTNASTGGTITLGQNITASSLSMSSGQSGSYIIDGGGFTLTVASLGNNNTTANLTVNAVVAGSSGLNKINNGKLFLTNANTYTGTTIITAGTLSAGVVSGTNNNLGNSSSAVTLGSATTLGTLSYTGSTATFGRGFTVGGAGGGRLDVTTSGQTLTVGTGNVTGTGLLTIGGAGNTTISSNLTHAGGLTKVDAGTLKLTGTANTYSGTTTISGGTLEYSSGTAQSWSGLISGTGILKKTGANALTLSGSNDYSGATIINEGVLNVTTLANATVASSIGAATDVSGNLVINGGTLRHDAANIASTNRKFAAGLNGATIDSSAVSATNIVNFSTTQAMGFNAQLGTRTVTLTGSNSGQNVMALDIRNDGSNNATSMIKDGAGTWLLTSNLSNYSGGTTVLNGTLLANNTTGSATGSGTVTVSSGATLGGTGAISGAVNVSGVLAPGASVQTLSSGTLSFANNSTFAYEVDSSVGLGAGGDLQKVTGNLNLTGTVTLTLGDVALTDIAFPEDALFSLINYTGTWNGGLFTFGGNELSDNEVFTAGLNSWKIIYNAEDGGSNFSGEFAGTTDRFINITAVPEPAASLLGGIGVFFLLRRRRNS
ncbi:MAG: hypothetical protein RLZZ214_116 [Verrucomicrobiota bacterium]|jgi:fibronectin-binding autotransporter adhesin